MARVRLQCFGTKGGLVWPESLVLGETNRVPWTLKVDETPKRQPHLDEIFQFALAVRNGLPSPVPVEESLNVIRILEAFYRSGKAQREVAVE